MAVASGRAALDALRRLSGDEQVPLGELLHDPYLPAGLVADPLPDGPTADTMIGGYGDPARYRFEDPTITACACVGGGRDDVCRHSLDLTMQGGATSGVVYPLAICELATQFRFRNVGGSSVGGIAAALAAAAEVGRSASTGAPSRAVVEDSASAGTGGAGAGFTGLAALTTWLTEDDRLAGLFRPQPRMRGWFRALVAVLRGRWWAAPTLVFTALGWATWISLLILIATVVGITGMLGVLTGEGFGAVLPWALLDTLLGLAVLHGALGIALTVPARLPPVPTWVDSLRRVSSRAPTRWRLLTPAIVTAIGVCGLALRPTHLAATASVGVTGVVLNLLCAALVLRARWTDADAWQFGMVGGATGARPLTLLDRLAGLPQECGEAVVPWVSRQLSALAGVHGDVLRFGHLWLGPGYTAGDDVGRAADSPDHRLVNLELIATDLTSSRPFRFPRGDPRLHSCPDELGEVFEPAVLDVLRSTPPITSTDEFGHTRTLHPLPAPADLPVVVAVRLGMGLPGLFTAVPLYRWLPARPVVDDLGRPIVGLTEPERAERAWFSDGGLSSNFPVHLFDHALPRWPTVSLNLGPHRTFAPHLDVELPQDWEPSPTAPEIVGSSMTGLLVAAVKASLGWRDRLQSDMPGFRSRIAQVHRHPGEGGVSLFMTPATIASLALRGALAGTRLRARYADPRQWDRFRWLRLRTALSITEQARHQTAVRAPHYTDPLAAPAWLDAREAAYPYRVTWYRPIDDFWPEGAAFVQRIITAHKPSDPDPLTSDVPLPEPELRQVPKE